MPPPATIAGVVINILADILVANAKPGLERLRNIELHTAAQGFVARLAFFQLPQPPPADARRADLKALASFAMCCPSLYSGQDQDPEIK
jgi:hypothetical protein